MSFDPTASGVILKGTAAGGDVAAAIEYVRDTLVTPIEGQPHLFVVGETVRDLSPNMDPIHQTAARQAYTTDGFTGLVDLLKQAPTVIFADTENPYLVAVIDFGTADVPTRDLHSVQFTPRYTPEWIAWSRVDGEMIQQESFANLIEEQRATITDPDAATLLEAVQDVRGHRNVEFQSAKRLRSGETQFAYVEKITTGARGTLDLPSELSLEFSIFRGEEPVTVRAYLRYSIDEQGRLRLGVRLQDVHALVRDAVEAIVEQVKTDLPDVPVFEGRPA